MSRAAAIALSLVLLALALASPRARAEEWTTDDCQEVDVKELAASDALLSRRLFGDVKVTTVFGQQLLVEGTEVPFVLSREVRDVAESLKEGDNLRAFGFLTKDRTGQRVFYVKRLEIRSTDPELFRQEFERLVQAREAERLYALGERLGASSKTDPALELLSRQAFEAAVGIEREKLDPNDAAQVLALADNLARRLGDRKGALELLTRLVEPGQQISAELDRRLREIRAVRYGTERRWMLYEEMKEKEGFVLYEGAWVQADRAEMLRVVEARLKAEARSPRSGLPEFFIQAAKAKTLLVGMNKRESAIARGFPDRVDRVRRDTRIFDAWYYDDGTALYFENDILFRKP